MKIMHFGSSPICGCTEKLTTKFKITFKSWVNRCIVCECLLLINKK